MGGQILAGREFTDAEVRLRARVAVVNERFAREFGVPMEVIGRQLTARRQLRGTIVGVVKGMEYETDPSVANEKQVFVPSQRPGGFLSAIVARVDGRGKIRIVLLRHCLLMVMSGAIPGIVIARLLGQFLRSVGGRSEAPERRWFHRRGSVPHSCGGGGHLERYKPCCQTRYIGYAASRVRHNVGARLNICSRLPPAGSLRILIGNASRGRLTPDAARCGRGSRQVANPRHGDFSPVWIASG
jgi:hypothetical protein